MNFTLNFVAHKNASAIVLASELSRNKKSIIDINRNTNVYRVVEVPLLVSWAESKRLNQCKRAYTPFPLVRSHVTSLNVLPAQLTKM